MPDNIHILEHPLASHHLAILRNRETDPHRFRASINRLALLLAFEATHDLSTRPTTVQTPIKQAEAAVLDKRIAIVPILRAGVAMLHSVLELIPTAEVWHLGVYRDEQTHMPVEYYHKLPANDPNPPAVAFIIDPMLATGGSAVWAIRQLRNWGVPYVKLLSLIASRPGIEHVHECEPAVAIHVCALDHQLDEMGNIVPGLGDAGDRAFNTPV